MPPIATPDPELLAAARAAAARAHAPYSRFHVGAALRSASGRVHAGCNVENAAYPLTGCAERHAIAAGVLAEGADFAIAELLVVAVDADGGLQPAPPCGGCRQQILEHGRDARVQFVDGEARWCVETVQALLPFGFRLD